MQNWAERNPKQAGALLVAIGALMAVLNIVLLVTSDRYYPVLFPVAGACTTAGVLQAITGVRARPGAPIAENAPAFVAAVVGFALGIGANVLVFGSAS